MVIAAGAQAQETLTIGVMATLEGTYTVLGEDGIRGMELAMEQAGYEAGGRPIEVIIAATDASPDSAVRAARKLVEQDQVDIVIGPLSGSEGIAIRDYAKTQPQVTFINGSSGAQETTYVTPAENFFRFNMDGAQWSVGLGNYIYNEKGYRNIVTIAEDYSFTYTQVFGLALEFVLPAARSPSASGCRWAQAISPRSSPPFPTMSTRSTWAWAAAMPSTS